MINTPVSQEARDAAADHVANMIGMSEIAARIRAGDFDHHETVQTFARLEQVITYRHAKIAEDRGNQVASNGHRTAVLIATAIRGHHHAG